MAKRRCRRWSLVARCIWRLPLLLLWWHEHPAGARDGRGSTRGVKGRCMCTWTAMKSSWRRSTLTATVRGTTSWPVSCGAYLGVAQGTQGRAEHPRGRGSTMEPPRGRTLEERALDMWHPRSAWARRGDALKPAGQSTALCLGLAHFKIVKLQVLE
jgi:hypothetical protein